MSEVMERPVARNSGRDLGLKATLGRTPVIAAVDLGASKVACFIMKPDGVRRSDNTLTTAGVGYVASRGVKGGTIVDIDQAAAAIAQAVERAETQAGLEVQSVVVSTALGQLASHRVAVQVPLGGARGISEADLGRAAEQALAGVRLGGRQAIHLQPISWSVDGQKHVRDPREMYGRVLGLELLIVSMNDNVYQTLGHCVERAHLGFEGVVASPFASSLSALDDEERELGAICIDMGGGPTSVAVWANGALAHVDTLGVGGGHVTQDVAHGLSTSLTGAERIKTLHGSAIASANEDREIIEAPARGDDLGAGPILVPRSILKGIISTRVEETFELLRERLRGAGALANPTAQIVLTGGASQLVGAREVALRVFDRPVSVRQPRRIPNLANTASGPAFCAAAGVLQRAAFGPRELGPRKTVSRRPEPVDPNAGLITRISVWLRDNLISDGP